MAFLNNINYRLCGYDLTSGCRTLKMVKELFCSVFCIIFNQYELVMCLSIAIGVNSFAIANCCNC